MTEPEGSKPEFIKGQIVQVIDPTHARFGMTGRVARKIRNRKIYTVKFQVGIERFHEDDLCWCDRMVP